MLGHVGAAREPLRRRLGAADGEPPGAWLAQAADRLQQGRLAAAGGADQADDAGGRQLEVDPAQRLQLAVGVAEAADRDAVAGRRRRPEGAERACFRIHPDILAHSALLTNVVRKVDKHPVRNPRWTRQ